MKQLIFTNRSLQDIANAQEWYDNQQENLGKKFADYIFKSSETIKANPLAYPCKYKFVREMFVKKYPFVITYSIEEQFIFILRVFPCKTNPKKKYK